MKPVKASQITSKAPPNCPSCGEPMVNYGGSAGYIHCGWKLLHRAGGWFGSNGLHVKDERLAGGTRRVDGQIRERAA